MIVRSQIGRIKEKRRTRETAGNGKASSMRVFFLFKALRLPPPENLSKCPGKRQERYLQEKQDSKENTPNSSHVPFITSYFRRPYPPRGHTKGLLHLRTCKVWPPVVAGQDVMCKCRRVCRHGAGMAAVEPPLRVQLPSP